MLFDEDNSAQNGPNDFNQDKTKFPDFLGIFKSFNDNICHVLRGGNTSDSMMTSKKCACIKS